MQGLVIQSYRTEAVPAWIERCLTSVRDWAAGNDWQYRFMGDEILDLVPKWYHERAQGRLPVITDLGRLLAVRDALDNGMDTVVWIDADVLVFDPDGFDPTPSNAYAFAREVWVQPASRGGFKVFRNVHNAACAFRRGNAMLDFYIHACLSIMECMEGPPAPQIVGPKLLTALHNIIGFRLLPQVGAFSPLTLGAIAEDGGPVLDLYRRHARGPARAVNLCLSLNQKSHEPVLERACERLLETRGDIVNG